jgi:hypothetical protein
MNKSQYNKLSQKEVQPTTIGFSDLVNKKDRTLLYGYTIERDTFHVYLKNKFIHIHIYGWDTDDLQRGKFTKITKRGRVLPVEELIPNKRVYPAKSDYEFCKKLLDMGCEIPFTTFEDGEEKQYYGELYE